MPTSPALHLRASRIASHRDWSKLKAQGGIRRYATVSNGAVITRDDAGRITEVLEPDAEGKATLQTDFTYGAQGKVVKIVQHGAHNDAPRIRSFTYDGQSRVISSTSPEAGTISYTYDTNGNIATKTDARNLTITYTWDAKHRLLGKTYSDGSPAVHIFYDDTTVAAYRGTLDAPLNERIYHYDSRGHLTGLTIDAQATQNKSTVTIALQYDASGRLTGITYPDGTILTQAWGTRGRLDSIFSSTIRYFSAPTYSVSDYLTGYTLGDAIAVKRSSDGTGHLKELSATSHGKQQIDKVYAYTPSGDIASFSDKLDPTSSFHYSYDPLDRVTKAEQIEGNGRSAFDYDPFGNHSSPALSENKPQFDAHNRFVGSSGLTYDTAGEMTFDGIHRYTYNADGYIASVDDGIITYRYDAEGNRVLKTVKSVNGTAETRYIWLDNQLLAQQQPDGTWIDYIYADGNRIASTSTRSDLATGSPGADATTYFVTDTVGLTRVALSADGTVLSQGDFAPFGTLLRDHTSHSMPGVSSAASISYTGEVHDNETGLDTYKYRSYNPKLGRWMSPDPSGEHFANLASPQSLNLYSYVLNDPLKYVDTLGLCATECSTDPCGDDSCDSGGGGDDGGGDDGGGDDGSDPCPVDACVTATPDPPIAPDPGDPSTVSLTVTDPGGASTYPAAPDVVKHFTSSTACSSTSTQVMSALEGNFAEFADYISSTDTSLTFSPPAGGLGQGSSIPITLTALYGTQDQVSYNTSVTVASISNQSMTFATVSGHALYPGSITFSATQSSAGSITFNVDVAGNFANIGYELGYYAGGSALENGIWNNLLQNVGAYCQGRLP